MMSVSSCLLPADSEYFAAECEGIPRTHVDDDYKGWVKHHTNLFAEKNMRRPSAAQLDSFADGLCSPGMAAWFKSIALREKEVAWYWSSLAKPTDEESYVDLSQSIYRSSPMVGAMMTFTEYCRPWMVTAQRILTGREMLALQGMSPRSMTRGTSDNTLCVLAGNAFNASCAMGALVALTSFGVSSSQ